MNGEDFYEEFKEALKFIGLRWGEKDKATIEIWNGSIVISYGFRKVGIDFAINGGAYEKKAIRRDTETSGQGEESRKGT